MMAGSSSGSSSSTASSSPSSSSSRRSLHTRASSIESTGINLSNLYLTTGLATLAAFYVLLLTLVLTTLRIYPFNIEQLKAYAQSQGRRQRFKQFMFHVCRSSIIVSTCRAFTFVNSFALLGVAARSTQLALMVKSGLSLTGADGLGFGLGRKSISTGFLTSALLT